jgi:AAA+ ATPase superfamily predicted ATPase
MKPLFIGREPEIEHFGQFLKKKTASLIVCQGRRRIGKSTLFRHCAEAADHFLLFEGLPPRDKIGKQNQLEAFAERIAAQTKAPKVDLPSWPQAFQLLDSVLPATGSTVLLLDEISWMATGDPDFPGYLKSAWDNLFSQRARLIVVLCGSVSSWIQANLSADAPGNCSCRPWACPPAINSGEAKPSARPRSSRSCR